MCCAAEMLDVSLRKGAIKVLNDTADLLRFYISTEKNLCFQAIGYDVENCHTDSYSYLCISKCYHVIQSTDAGLIQKAEKYLTLAISANEASRQSQGLVNRNSELDSFCDEVAALLLKFPNCLAAGLN